MLNKLKNTHVIHHSLFPDRAAGGVVTLLRRGAFPSGATFSLPLVLVTGRALVSQITYDNSHIEVLNIHNDSFEPADTHAITSWARRCANTATRSPSSFAAVACGDFNFSDDDDHSAVLSASLNKTKNTLQAALLR